MTVSLLSRLNCYLSGHDYCIRQSGGRMFLYCTACGHRSDGIFLTGRDDDAPRDGRHRRSGSAGSDAAAPQSRVARQ